MKFSELQVKISANVDSFTQGLRVVNADLAKTNRQIASQTIGFRSLSQTMTDVGQRMTLGVTAPIVGLGAAALKTASSLEVTQTAFTTMLRSGPAATAMLNDLKKFAASTPFQFTELTDATRKMLALGFSAKEVIPTLRNVGDAAGALGLGAEGINRIILALGQMKAKGTVQAEEMRQLAEAGIPAWDALAAKLNTDVAGAMKMVQDRAVSSAIGIDAVTTAMRDRFGGGMEAQAQTLVGVWSNVQDKVTFALADIGKNLLPLAKSMVEGFINPAIDGAKRLAAAFADLPVPIQQTAVAMTGVAASIGPLIWITGGAARAFLDLRSVIGIIAPLAKGAAVEIVGLTGALGGLFAVAMIFKQGKDTWDKFMESIQNLRNKAFGAQAAAFVRETGMSLETAAQSTAKLDDAFNQLGFKSTKQLTEELKTAKEALVRVQQAFNSGAASAEDLANAKDAVRKASELLHPSLKQQGVEWKNLGNAMQGPLTQTQAMREAMSDLVGEKMRERTQKGIDAWNEAILRVAGYGTAVETVTVEAKAFNDTINDVQISDYWIKWKYAVDEYGNGITDAQNKLRALQLQQDSFQFFDFSNGFPQATNPNDGFKGGIPKPVINVVTDKEAEKTKQNLQEISTVINDLNRDLVNLAFEGGKFKDVMTGAATSIGKAFSRMILTELMQPFEDAMKQAAKWVASLAESIVKNLVKGAFGQLGKAIGSSISQLGGLGTAISKIFGGGGAAASTTAAATTSTGGIGAAASAGVTGIVGAVAGVASAISGIIGNFQMAGMNKSLDVLVKHTLQLVMIGEAVFKLIDMRLDAIHARLFEMRTYGLGVWPQPGYEWALSGGGGGGNTFSFVIGNVYGGPAGLDALADEIIRRLVQRGLKIS